MDITIYLQDVKPFLRGKNAQRVLLRYLHDRGIEGEIGCDEQGDFIRYMGPEKGFDEFSLQFYLYITNHR